MKPLRPLALCAVLLPTLALAALIALKETALAGGPAVRLPITGYDPRDLLYGHYINFRFDYTAKPIDQACASAPSGGAPGCRLCVHAATDFALLPAAKAAKCARSLPLTELTGARRYYIPEAAGPELDRLLRNRNLKLTIDIHASGESIAYGQLYVEGQPWPAYLKANPPPP